jgi:hypothetical protein
MFTRYALSLVALVAVTAPSAAQQFDNGNLYVGPRVWIGNLNGSAAIGGQIERGFTAPGEVGPGIIGGGVGVDYYSWSQNLTLGDFNYSVVPFQLFGNYHFVIEKNRRIDPYLGLAFVYSMVSSSWDGTGIGAGASVAGNYTTFAGQGGVRYFMSDRVSLQGQVGFGYGTLGMGATFKL